MAEQFIEELEIDAIRRRGDLSEDQKRENISELRSYTKSILKKKNKSHQTIASIANTMIGSCCLVLPLLFRGSGLVSSIIILSLIGLISYKTCDLIITHTKEKDEDLTYTVNRLLGKKFYLGYCVSSSLLLFFCCLVYFILMVNMIYHIVVFCFDKSGSSNYASIDDSSFSQFSMQYTSLAASAVVFILVQLKNLRFIVKLGEVGILALMTYTVFIIVRGFINIGNGTASAHLFEVEAFTTNYNDIINIAGTFALAFIVHSVVVPIIKHNENQEKNSRDLAIGYTIGGGVYIILGILGCFAIVGSEYCPKDKHAHTVVDCFEKTDISVLVIEILFFLHLVTVLPLVIFISRMQFFQMFYETVEAPWYFKLIFNIFFVLVCLVIGIFNVDPSNIISFTGAVCGFYLVYIIPIGIHFSCIYKEKKTVEHGVEDDHRDQKTHLLGKVNETQESMCGHDDKIRLGVSRTTRTWFYGFFILFGIILVGVQIYQIADTIEKTGKF